MDQDLSCDKGDAVSVRAKPLDFPRSELTEYEAIEEEAISRSATVWEEINEKMHPVHVQQQRYSGKARPEPKLVGRP